MDYPLDLSLRLLITVTGIVVLTWLFYKKIKKSKRRNSRKFLVRGG